METKTKKCRICGDPWPHNNPDQHKGATDLWTGKPLIEGPIVDADTDGA